MVTCVVIGCTNRSGCNSKLNGITFHAVFFSFHFRFPKDEGRKALWVISVGRKNWKTTKWSTICSQHFREEDIDRTSLSTVRIRENAVPTIFPAAPRHLRKVRKEECISQKRRGNVASSMNWNEENVPREELFLQKTTKKITSFKKRNEGNIINYEHILHQQTQDMKIPERHENVKNTKQNCTFQKQTNDYTMSVGCNKRKDEQLSISQKMSSVDVPHKSHTLPDNPVVCTNQNLATVIDQNKWYRRKIKLLEETVCFLIKENTKLKGIIKSLQDKS